MKKWALILVAIVFSGTLFGQNAYEGKFNFSKKLSPLANGVGLKTKKSPDIMEATIEKKFSESMKKAKAKKVAKNIIGYESVVLAEVSPMTMDYYFKIEEVSKGTYIVEMFLSLGNYNFITSAKFPNEIEAAKRFMNKLAGNAEVNRIAALIEQQEEKIKEQQKEHEKLIKTRQDLVKSHEKMVADIKKNEAEQEKVAGRTLTSQETLKKLQGELLKLQEQMKKLR